MLQSLRMTSNIYVHSDERILSPLVSSAAVAVEELTLSIMIGGDIYINLHFI